MLPLVQALALPLAALLQAPSSEDLVYGRTEIAVGPAPGAQRIDVLLDDYPDPICRLPAAGGLCVFDAGSSFEARRLRTVAIDASGRTVAEDARVTRGFPAPVRVEARSLLVPVVAEAPLLPNDLLCRLGNRDCRVVEVLPSTDRTTSIEILVDVSDSMRASRQVLKDHLRRLLGSLPMDATVSLAQFAETYRQVVPPTRDAATLQAGVDLIEDGASTCLWAALAQSLESMAARPGLRVLVALTDGSDTCADGPVLAPPAAVVDAVRRSAARLYLFRAGHFSQGRALELLSWRSGGRQFGRGGFVGLERALDAIAADVASTFLADIEPGPGYRDGQRLKIAHRAERPIVAPSYPPASAEQRHLMTLAAAEGTVRGEAAASLAEAPTRAALQGLTVALEGARHDRALQDAFARCAAALLLHGDPRDQDAALEAAERLARSGLPLAEPLAAALRIYPRTSPEQRHAQRAVALAPRRPG